MNAFKIWIAQHPREAGNREVRITEPDQDPTFLYSDFEYDDDAYVNWVEHVCIPIQE
jgi:hypothetical protein